MDRRKFILGSTSALTGSLLLPRIVGSAAAQELPAGAVASGILDALPGKQPLIKRSFRPPNYETPVSFFAMHSRRTMPSTYAGTPGVPEIALAEWRLRVSGPGVKSEREFTYDTLRRKFKMRKSPPSTSAPATGAACSCRTCPASNGAIGAMGNAVWRGVRLKDVLEDAGLNAGALEVVGNGADAPTLTGPDFVKSLPMWKALDPDTLIAFEMNGEPLPKWNGFPARLVAPGWTATYWIKAVADLTVTDKPFDGFWMKTAYRVPKGMFGASGFESQDTEQNSPITSIKVNSLVVDPAPGAVLERGKHVEVLGIAWDGGSGIRSVEVSLDGGESWRDAKLGAISDATRGGSGDIAIKPEQAGAMTLMARAHARDGSTQADTLVHNPAGYHHNVVQKVDYHVA